VIDVSQYTKDGPAQLTLRYRWLLWCNFDCGVSSEYRLYGGMRLALTQTPREFRPRDSREPAIADCGGHQGDCYPTFTAKLVNGLEGMDLSAWAWANSSALDPASWPPQPDLKQVMEFKLEPPNDANGQPAKWLVGASTNGGDDKEPDPRNPRPDYKFDQVGTHNPTDTFTPLGGNELSISTVPGAKEATLTVASLDYGGVANVRANVVVKDDSSVVGMTVQGGTFDAEIVKSADDQTPVDPPTNAACAAKFSQHQFASLPVDQDCNGIADAWEDAHSKVNGAHLPPEWDQEPGYNGQSPKGDGFSVHDEYRGFHYVEDDGTTKRWTDTDPVNVQDVFYWDAVSANACAAAGQAPNCLTTALGKILAPETNSFIRFRRVKAKQANARSGISPELGALRFNQYSRYATNDFEAFALVYANYDLRDDGGARCDLARPTSGAVADAQSFTSDGSAVRIDFRQIGACAALKQFPAPVYLARTTAHETGHKFGLSHPLRRGPVLLIPTPADIQSLTQQQFTWDPLPLPLLFATLGVRLERYDYLGRNETSDDVLTTVPTSAVWRNKILAKTPIPPPPAPPPPAIPCGGLNDCVYGLWVWNSRQSNSLLIQSQPGYLMDWTPKFTLQNFAEWKFDPGDPANPGRGNNLQSMKVKCQGAH